MLKDFTIIVVFAMQMCAKKTFEHPLFDFIQEKNDIPAYKKLIYTISQIWSDSQDLREDGDHYCSKFIIIIMNVSFYFLIHLFLSTYKKFIYFI